jgi:hypothetical protein
MQSPTVYIVLKKAAVITETSSTRISEDNKTKKSSSNKIFHEGINFVKN